MRINKILSAVSVLSLLISVPANARIDGVDYVKLTVGGSDYSVPVGNKERQADLYLIKKALRHDREAREILIGDKNELVYFIGDSEVRWLHITKDKEWVS